MEAFIKEALTPKFIVLYVFMGCALYVHLRGKERHGLVRQFLGLSMFTAPYNCFCYLFSAVPNTPFLPLTTFPELKPILDNWETIRDEAKALQEGGHIGIADGHTDAGFHSFFKRGWRRFYFRWYDDFLPSAEALCPKTCEIMRQVPSVHAAMYTVLGPGSHLVPHRDPFAGSIRLHVGLVTPNSEDCYIYVDGEKYVWRDGEAVLFDETYIHRARNETDETRIIFFADVERPLKTPVARWINRTFSRFVVGLSTTRNVKGEKVGLLNRIFQGVYPIRAFAKKVRRKSKPVYYLAKFALIGAVVWFIFLR